MRGFTVILLLFAGYFCWLPDTHAAANSAANSMMQRAGKKISKVVKTTVASTSNRLVSMFSNPTVVSVIVAAAIAASPVFASHNDRTKFLWPGAYLDAPVMQELWLASASGGGKEGHGQGRAGFSVLLNDVNRYNSRKEGYGFLQAELSVDNYQTRLPLVRAHLIRDYASRRADDLWVIISSTGYDYHDYRADDLDREMEGFTAHHLHVMGVETPVLSSSIGVGSLGFVEVGNFSQVDLNAWAGERADLSHVLFHNGSLGFKWMPWDGLSFDVHLRQARTIGGDIDFADGMDGDFTAIWEELSLQAKQILLITEDSHDEYSILAELRLYRQRINADDEAGNSFSSRQDGKKALVKIQLSFD